MLEIVIRIPRIYSFSLHFPDSGVMLSGLLIRKYDRIRQKFITTVANPVFLEQLNFVAMLHQQLDLLLL